MSGGVDSSVAALLLKDQGYDVVGAHMKLWDYADVGGDSYRDGRCCSLDAINDCRHVCNSIGAPFYVLDLTEHFRKVVIKNFVTEYKTGRTPNPCVLCNSEVKWAEFLRKARQVGCDYIATGHYATVDRNADSRYYIRKGVDKSREQSYVLWGLTQEALSMTLMPLGGLLKSEVREIAAKHELRTAGKKESREICFIADDDYKRFLTEYEHKQGRRFTPGEIVHDSGRVLGQHDGSAFYTIGQRRGLGIAHPTPLYVLEIDAASNRVIVGDDESLFRTVMTIENINWVAIEQPSSAFDAEVKIRYQHQASPARLEPLSDGTVLVNFDHAQRAITPGQSAVFYDGDILLGGGIIV